MFSPPSASAVPSAIANSSTGKDQRMSNRLRIDPVDPASEVARDQPEGDREHGVMSAAMKPTNSELRPP